MEAAALPGLPGVALFGCWPGRFSLAAMSVGVLAPANPAAAVVGSWGVQFTRTFLVAAPVTYGGTWFLGGDRPKNGNGSHWQPWRKKQYGISGHAMAGGSLCQVFEISVEQTKSNFALYFNKRREAAAYHGRVFIEEETGLVRKRTIEGSGLPPLFGLQSPSFSLDYGMVKVGTQDYLLPLRSVLQVRQDKLLVRNEAVFRDYRKFEASSEMMY